MTCASAAAREKGRTNKTLAGLQASHSREENGCHCGWSPVHEIDPGGWGAVVQSQDRRPGRSGNISITIQIYGEIAETTPVRKLNPAQAATGAENQLRPTNGERKLVKRGAGKKMARFAERRLGGDWGAENPNLDANRAKLRTIRIIRPIEAFRGSKQGNSVIYVSVYYTSRQNASPCLHSRAENPIIPLQILDTGGALERY